jgi:hypothetical protein
MSDDTDKYRRRADECCRLAAMAPIADDKAFWLRVAEDWRRVADVAVSFAKSQPHDPEIDHPRAAGLGVPRQSG